MKKKKSVETAWITGAALGISGPVLADEKDKERGEKTPKKTGIGQPKTRKTTGRRRQSGS
jgi:hypothetical protein